jgi:hypothetical protein
LSDNAREKLLDDSIIVSLINSDFNIFNIHADELEKALAELETSNAELAEEYRHYINNLNNKLIEFKLTS